MTGETKEKDMFISLSEITKRKALGLRPRDIITEIEWV